MSLFATILLSFLSTCAGAANKWTPSPNAPNPDPNAPPGDVVIRYAQGAFIVVLCPERTSRYLYFNPSERCIYMIRSSTVYRFLSLVSTLLLMGGVICLANAKIQSQTVWAGTYMLIQICYWACGKLSLSRPNLATNHGCNQPLFLLQITGIYLESKSKKLPFVADLRRRMQQSITSRRPTQKRCGRLLRLPKPRIGSRKLVGLPG